MTDHDTSLDTASLRILDALQQDAELSNAALAERVNRLPAPAGAAWPICASAVSSGNQLFLSIR